MRLLTHQYTGLVPKLQQFGPLAPLQSLVAVQRRSLSPEEPVAAQLVGGLSLQLVWQDEVNEVTKPAQPVDVLPPPASTNVPQQTSPSSPHSPGPVVPAQLTA
jgi:hypothetical protein